MRDLNATALVFVTSAAVLVTEIIAGRLMAPYVGVSLETFTGIIGTILAGIALGSALGGRVADVTDPARLVPALVVVGGGLVWLSLPIVTALGPQLGEGPVAIVALTTAAFLAPAAVLSAVPPMVAKLRLDHLGETGTVVGRLSAAATAGALAGTFLTGFVLIAYLPSRVTVITTGALLVLIGVALWVRARTRVGLSATAMALVAAGVTGALALGVTTSTPCEHETVYYCVRVETDPANPDGRLLVLDTLNHSYVDLADPTLLDFRYVRLFADVAGDLPDGPLDALHVGGGGFTFPRYLTAVRPGSTNTVLEIDPDLVDIAREELGLVTGPALEVRTGDARLSIGDLPADAYDLVVGDAFGGRSVPWHLTTEEFLDEVHRVLRPDGVYVMNVIDGGDAAFARAQLATLQRVFAWAVIVTPPDGIPRFGAANLILVASDRARPGLDVDPSDGTAVTDQGALGRLVAGAQVLTDDYAPVDRLLTW